MSVFSCVLNWNNGGSESFFVPGGKRLVSRTWPSGTLLLIILVLLGYDAAWAQPKVVRLATLTDFPPFCFRKEPSQTLPRERIPPGSDSVQLQGASWDVVRDSFHAVGYVIELRVVPWSRGMLYLNSGRVDGIFPANKTEKRKRQFQFSQNFVDRIRMVVYATQDTDIQWQGLKSLEGRRVGVVRDWAYGGKWAAATAVQREHMDSIQQSFRVLMKRRVDAVVGYETAYDMILKNESYADEITKIGYFDRLEEYLMVRKDHPEAKEILGAFDKGHEQLQRAGRFSAVSGRGQGPSMHDEEEDEQSESKR